MAALVLVQAGAQPLPADAPSSSSSQPTAPPSPPFSPAIIFCPFTPVPLPRLPLPTFTAPSLFLSTSPPCLFPPSIIDLHLSYSSLITLSPSSPSSLSLHCKPPPSISPAVASCWLPCQSLTLPPPLTSISCHSSLRQAQAAAKNGSHACLTACLSASSCSVVPAPHTYSVSLAPPSAVATFPSLCSSAPWPLMPAALAATPPSSPTLTRRTMAPRQQLASTASLLTSVPADGPLRPSL